MEFNIDNIQCHVLKLPHTSVRVEVKWRLTQGGRGSVKKEGINLRG